MSMSDFLALPSQLAHLSPANKSELIKHLHVILTASTDKDTDVDKRAKYYLAQVIRALQTTKGPL